MNLFQHSKLFIQVKESECECNEPKENAKKGASFSKIRKGEQLVFKLRKYLEVGDEPGNKRGENELRGGVEKTTKNSQSQFENF